MSRTAHDLAHRLAREAEAVCRHYLSNGRHQGGYWQVGDVRNAAGRSMFVRLHDGAKGSAGKWTDAATGEHGDLLDVIGEALGLADFTEIADEARRFLNVPRPEPQRRPERERNPPVVRGSSEAARRLLGISKPIGGTLAARYLRGRGITDLRNTEALRSHPQCYYRPDHGPTETWPAMIAAVTDPDGTTTGAHRTWLARDGSGKAPIEAPRKAMGDLLGNAVRFGGADEIMAAGEGIETVLSARQVLPGMPMLAALSAAHLAAILFPPTLRRLYILSDDDPAGADARDTLTDRARSAGIEAIALMPRLGDFNDDLRLLDIDAMRSDLRVQLAPEDVERAYSGL